MAASPVKSFWSSLLGNRPTTLSAPSIHTLYNQATQERSGHAVVGINEKSLVQDTVGVHSAAAAFRNTKLSYKR